MHGNIPRSNDTQRGKYGVLNTMGGNLGVLNIYRGALKLPGAPKDMTGSNGYPQGHICIYVMPIEFAPCSPGHT